ncbi:MAG: isocitrate/isopropylmalate family dehydrogenase [Alphaproteobacteria bacterium]
MALKILVLPGDGIGPEITATAEAALQALDRRFGLGLDLSRRDIGFAALAKEGATWGPATEAACRAADGVVMGPTDTAAYPPPEEGGVGPSAMARKNLDLFANIRPSKSTPGAPALKPGVDLVVVRENTEGFYADRNMALGMGEFMPTPDTALAVRKITRAASERIAHVAFRMAEGRRKKVTVVHKANVLKMTCGLFLHTAETVAEAYPDVEVDECHVDAMASDLVRKPETFDIVLCSNMYGDILSNLAAEVTGGLGLAGSLNRGDDVSLAQAAHGSAPDIAGQGVANPGSILRSTAMLLADLGQRRSDNALAAAAAALDRGVDAMLADAATRTADMGGRLATADFGRLLAERLTAEREDAA